MSDFVRNAQGSFARPNDTTPYSIGDLVANSTINSSVVAVRLDLGDSAGFSSMMRRLKLRKTGTSVVNAAFRVHVFRKQPTTITNGDNGAFSVSGAADYRGAWDVTVDRAFTDGAVGFGVPVVGQEMLIALGDETDSVYCLIEARGAYTPANGETFAITVDSIVEEL